MGPDLAYADNEIGRVIQAVEDLGELDNTLIIYIGGDNGASAEGMLNGTPNEFTTLNGVPYRSRTSYSGIRSGDRNGRTRISQQAGRGRWTRRD